MVSNKLMRALGPRVRFTTVSSHNIMPHRRTPNSSVRQDSGEEDRNKKGSAHASPARPTLVPRPAEKITIELDEPLEEPSPKKNRTRSTSTSKDKEKHKIVEAPHEIEESQPASKKSRVRTSSKEKKDKWKVDDVSQDNEAEDGEKEAGWTKQAQSQAEDVFAGATRTVSVFKESDSWV